MLLTRFWYLILSVVVGISIAATALVRNAYENDRGRDSETLLTGDRRQIVDFLRTDARIRLNNLGVIASKPELERAVHAANARTSDAQLRDAYTRISQLLGQLNDGLGDRAKGQLLLAVDAHGMIIGRTGLYESLPPGEYFGAHTLVARALDGYARDDIWDLGDRVYRMAARPIVVQGHVDGAVVFAREIDSTFVQTLGQALPGATVAFFRRTRGALNFYATAEGGEDRGRAAPTVGSIADKLRDLPNDSHWRERGYTDVLDAQNNEGSVVFGAITGTLGAAGAGFAVARPKPIIPMSSLLHANKNELAKLPWVLILGFVLGGTCLGLLFVFLEYSRGVNGLEKMLRELADRKIERLDALKLAGVGRSLALTINEAFEKAMREELNRFGGRPRKSLDDIDSLLSSNPSDAQASAAFDAMLQSPAAPKATPAPPKVTPPAPAPRPVSPPVVAAPKPAVRPAKLEAEALDDSDLLEDVPPVEERTSVVPNAPSGGSGLFANEAEEQAHWKEVFERFLATKRECGEATDTLTFEKFSQTLKKHKDQLMQKTGCKSVRFNVYPKDGKATLKASPVKS